MYIPEIYENKNVDEVTAFIHENPFAILTTAVDSKVLATHIPLVLDVLPDGRASLEGHIAAANPQKGHLRNGAEALAIFNGPHAYISSSWYKKEEVPTWNYLAVHINGQLEIQNSDQLRASLEKLVNIHESHLGYETKLSDYSEKTLRQIRGIIGFRLHINAIQAAFKLSQGRPEDHEQIIAQLNKQGDSATKISEEIKKHCPRK